MLKTDLHNHDGIWGGVGGFLCMYISLKGLCDCRVKNRDWGWYFGQNEIPSGPNETHLGDLYERWAKVLQNWEMYYASDHECIVQEKPKGNTINLCCPSHTDSR